MRQVPIPLRRDGDPLDSLRNVAEGYENLVTNALAAHRARLRQPSIRLLIIGAPAFDAVVQQSTHVELIDDGELAEAAARAGIDGFDFDTTHAEELRGALTALRGAVGEQWVINQIASDQLPVPVSAIAAELQGFTHPGSDIAFTGPDGSVVAQANVKIAGSARVIVDHFRRHPDVSMVYASSDAAADAERRGLQVIKFGEPLNADDAVVIDIGRSSREFDNQIAEGLGLGGGIEHTDWDPDAIDALPFFSIGAIAVRATQRLRAGANRAELVRESGRDVVVASAGTVSNRAAAAVTSSEPAIVAIAAVASSLTYAATEVRRNWKELGIDLQRVADDAEHLADASVTSR